MAAQRRHPTLYQTYGDRSEDPILPPLATYLLRLAHLKRTNLCVSADVGTTTELLQLAEEVGDHICVLKTHADIIRDFTDKTTRGLLEVARRKQFVIFEDRKFGDIGNTLTEQYSGGPLTIVRWAPITNAHLLFGPDIITSLSQAAQKAITAHNTSVSTDISGPQAGLGARGSGGTVRDGSDAEDEDHDDDEEEDTESELEQPEARNPRKRSVVSVSTTISMKSEAISPEPSLRPSLSRGSTEESEESEEEDRETLLRQLGPPPFYRSLLLLAQVSSRGNLVTPQWTAETVRHARANRDFVMGFIAQESLNSAPDDNFITLTPGVQLAAGGDALGQQYNTPRKVITELGTDIIIVGRGVYAAQDRKRAALEYRRQGWQAYEERLKAGRKLRR